MEYIAKIWDLISRINVYLSDWVRDYPIAVYVILFGIIFCETGLVVMPFLPGDSLLFAIGAVAARPEYSLNIWLIFLILIPAAILGDSLNYWIGRRFSAIMVRKFPRVVKQDHLDKTNAFFARYGGKTIVIARFVPIIRTFAPFVAGSGGMDYRKFMYYNVLGAVLWVGLLVPAGYFFGGLPAVQKHFELVVIGIIVLSLIPAVIGALKARAEMRRADPGTPAE